MTGTHSTTFSPDSFSTSRSTPCVDGCCGPMLRMSSSVSSPSSVCTVGSSMSVPFRTSVSVALATLGDLFAEPEDPRGERFWTRRAARHVDIHGNDRVDALQGRVRVPELAAARCAVPHRDDPLRLGHLLVEPAQ